MKIKPQILIAILAIAGLGGMVIIISPDNIDKVVAGGITAIGMLSMKLLENE